MRDTIKNLCPESNKKCINLITDSPILLEDSPSASLEITIDKEQSYQCYKVKVDGCLIKEGSSLNAPKRCDWLIFEKDTSTSIFVELKAKTEVERCFEQFNETIEFLNSKDKALCKDKIRCVVVHTSGTNFQQFKVLSTQPEHDFKYNFNPIQVSKMEMQIQRTMGTPVKRMLSNLIKKSKTF